MKTKTTKQTDSSEGKGFGRKGELFSSPRESEHLLRSVIQGFSIPAFVIGKAFDPAGKKNDCLRLSFSHTPEDRIEEGIAKIARAMSS